MTKLLFTLTFICVVALGATNISRPDLEMPLNEKLLVVDSVYNEDSGKILIATSSEKIYKWDITKPDLHESDLRNHFKTRLRRIGILFSSPSTAFAMLDDKSVFFDLDNFNVTGETSSYNTRNYDHYFNAPKKSILGVVSYSHSGGFGYSLFGFDSSGSDIGYNIESNTGSFESGAVSPNGNLFVGIDSQKSLNVWDLVSSTKVGGIDSFKNVQMGNAIFISDEELLFSVHKLSHLNKDFSKIYSYNFVKKELLEWMIFEGKFVDVKDFSKTSDRLLLSSYTPSRLRGGNLDDLHELFVYSFSSKKLQSNLRAKDDSISISGVKFIDKKKVFGTTLDIHGSENSNFMLWKIEK